MVSVYPFLIVKQTHEEVMMVNSVKGWRVTKANLWHFSHLFNIFVVFFKSVDQLNPAVIIQDAKTLAPI